MKQLLFLLLFPAFALAQYPGNAGQKITLGEQTTADGLVYRGVLNDTALITPFSDTSAYIILDTVNNRFYNYNRATNVWSLAGGGVSVSSFSAGTTGLTPSTATTGAVTLGGTLAVANGGTNVTSLTNNGILYGSSTSQVATSSALTFDGTNFSTTGTATATKFIPTVTSASGNGIYLPVSNNISISTAGIENLRLTEKGNLGLGVDPDPMTSNNYKSIVLQGVTGGEILLNNSTTNVGYIYANINGAVLDGKGTFRFQTNAVDRLIVYSGGNVGIGTQIPSTGDTATAKLQVVGNARITAVGAGTFANNLNITSDGTLTTATSDEKYKYNIFPINYGLNTILQLKPVNFQWIKGEEQDLGFIAQDVAEIIPEAVSTNWNSDLLFRYESIIPILTKAIQEQQSLIKALEQRILILENK